MAFIIDDPRIGMPALTDTSTTQKVPLGTRVKGRSEDDGEGEFIYMLGVASTAAGLLCQLKMDDGSTALVDTDVADTLIGPCGIAMSANVASQYGWYQIYGKASGLAIVDGGAAENARVYPTSTAGYVDDVAVIASQVIGAKFASTEAGTPGTVELELNYPWIGTAVADS